MFAELHLPAGLPVDRDDVEEAIAEILEGAGEVSGAGTGVYGSNLDLELSGDIDRAALTGAISDRLAQLGVTHARIRFEDSDNWRHL